MTADIYLDLAPGSSGLEGVKEIQFYEDFEKEFLLRLLGVLLRSYTWNDGLKTYEIGPGFLKLFKYVDGDSGTIESILKKLRTPMFILDGTDRTDKTDGTCD